MLNSNFRVEHSSTIGRHLVSNQNFEQGDIIWEEAPLISAPFERYDVTPEYKFSCVTCFKMVNAQKMKCEQCGWPCCSLLCTKSEQHKEFECEFLKEREISVTSCSFRKLPYLRIALCKKNDPAKYEKLLSLCSDYPEAFQSTLLKNQVTRFIVSHFLTVKCNLLLTPLELSQILAIFQINNFKITFEYNDVLQYTGNAVYERACIASHCCSPNMESSFYKCLAEDEQISWNIRFYARRPIKRGDTLTIAYKSLPLHLGTIPRQRIMRKWRHFVCKCSRCLDRTEEDTYFSAIMCPDCKGGHLFSEAAIEMRSCQWKCSQCYGQKSDNWVECLLGTLQSQRVLSLFEMGSPTEESLTFADTFANTHWSTTLHKNHYLLFHCAVHWLMGKDFAEDLLCRSRKAKVTFNKVMTRVQCVATLAMKFWPSEANGNFHIAVAKILAVHFFHSKNMIDISLHELVPRDKVRFCKRFLLHLKQAVVWLKMKPTGSSHPKFVRRLEDIISMWSFRLEMYSTEANQFQEMALNSLPKLFQ